MNLPTHIFRSFRPDWVRAGAVQGRGQSAFTLIEIAISLAIIAFAMVAIIGVLPVGMSAQRENREETIINQDASIFMEAIRSGARGVDDLTNYVVAITNIITEFDENQKFVRDLRVWHTFNDSSLRPKYLLTNGFRIIGLLSTPKIIPIDPTPPATAGGHYSNYVVGIFRSLSGPASDKYPQTNAEVHDLSFAYRMIADVLPYSEFDTNWAWSGDPSISADTVEIASRSNYWREVKNLQTNLWDVRLTFRWPIKPNGQPGNGRQVYRSMVSGHLIKTNDSVLTAYPLFFFEPRNYVKAP